MTGKSYNETLRPQFHFTAREGWLNDPNGLVFYKGEYHLFFQHNPFGTTWGNMTWGHAVSTDLVHWTQLANALEPDALGTMFSGSAVVDWKNTAGFQTGTELPLIALYTAAGNTSPASKGKPSTQCLAYSNDCGRTWTKYGVNPVVANITAGNRDPKVIWHEATGRWIMALYVGEPIENDTLHMIYFLSSPDLKQWTLLSKVDGFFECPDLFELTVQDDNGNTRWVLFGADGRYVVGRFDGKQFVTESGKHMGDWGGNFYAAQTYSDIPASDGRRILVGWMINGTYPDMPFNQQMTFPCELTLRAFADGIRLCKNPVREIDLLYGKTHRWADVTVNPGDNPLASVTGSLFDVEAEIEPGNATEFGFDIRGHKVSYIVGDHELLCLGRGARLEPIDNRIKVRLLVDRASVEVFGNDGRVASSSCFLPKRDTLPFYFYANGGTVRIVSLKVHELKSSWV